MRKKNEGKQFEAVCAHCKLTSDDALGGACESIAGPVHEWVIKPAAKTTGEKVYESPLTLKPAAIADCIAALKLATIADAYDANELDDEARKFWGDLDDVDARENQTPPEQIVLYSGRGGKTLLTLADCFAAREALGR
jgi:hypothetical protein